MNLSIQSVKAFYRHNGPLIALVLAAREAASVLHEQVDAYTIPLLATFDLKDDKGKTITDPTDLYLCDDDTGCTAFYAACDQAHKENGFELEPGYCPALVVKHEVVSVERALLKAAGDHYGINFAGIHNLKLRTEALDLLTNPPIK